MSKRGDAGAPAGRLLDKSLMAGSLGGADDLDDGRESLEAVCVDTEAEVRFSVGSMAGKRATRYEGVPAKIYYITR